MQLFPYVFLWMASLDGMTIHKFLCLQLSADIYLRSKGNEASPIIIGRASAKVDENGFAGISVLTVFCSLILHIL